MLNGNAFLLVWFLWCGPFDFARKIDALGLDPFVKSLIELFIMDIELGPALARLNR